MASDGSVTIKVRANDTALKDLLKSVQGLKEELNSLSNLNPFNNIAEGARRAFQSVNELTNGTTDLNSSLSDVSGDGLHNVAEGAYDASSGLSDASSGAYDTSAALADIDGNSLYQVSEGAYDASASLGDVDSSAYDVAMSLGDIDSDGLYSVSDGAYDASSSLGDVSSSAYDVSSSLGDIDGDSLYDVADGSHDASSGLHDVGSSAYDASASLADIHGDGLYDVSDGAHDASSGLYDVSSSAYDASSGLSDIHGDGLHDVADSSHSASTGLHDVASSGADASDSISQIEPSSIDKTDQSTKSLNISLLDIAKGVGVVRLLRSAFDMLTGSIDSAIWRFDTLNTYPRTMEALGYSTDQVDRSMRRLDEGIQGLPTKLDQVVKNTQRIASVTGDLDKATETTLALNNAFLASGASASDAARGTEQYIQMLSAGRVDMQSWRTLQEAMPLALNKTAEAFGFAGESAQNDFYGALRDGEITFNQFNDKLIELSEATGGFADLAKTNSESLRTSMRNVQTAFARGIANIIQDLDNLSRAITGNSIAQNIDALQGVVNSAFSSMSNAIQAVSPIIETTVSAFTGLINVLRPLTPLIKGVVAGIIAMRVANEVSSYVSTLQLTMTALSKAYKYAELTNHAYTASMVQGSIVTKALATAYGVLTGAISAKTAVVGLSTAAWTTFKSVLTLMSGPIGWIIAAIGLLVGGLVTLWQTLGQTSPEMERLTSEIDDQVQKTSELTDSMAQSSEAYETQREKINGQSEAMNKLIEETVALSEQEKLNAGDKKLLQENIEQLNESMAGLNLAYDEEAGRLTTSNEHMKARVEMMNEENQMAEARQRLVEIEQERAEATSLLDENSRKLNEAQIMLDESGANWFGRNNELKESVSSLQEENTSLQERLTSLGEEEQRVNEMRSESARRYAEAQEQASQQAITSLEQLGERQRAVVEEMQAQYTSLEEHTTNMFDQISQKSALSIEEMNANLEQNQQVVAEWADGLQTLSERGVDQGLLEQLRRVGPEGLPYVQELVNATPEEMSRLEDNFRNGGETANQALFDSLGIKPDQLIDGVPELVTRTEQDLVSNLEGSGLKEAAPNELKKGREDMVEAGRDLGEGAAVGIDEGAVKAGESSRNMAKDVNDQFSNELGIQSPSTVFAQHGRDVIAGLIQGLETGSSQVVTIIQQMGQAMNTAMTQSVQQMTMTSTTAFVGFTTSIQNSLSQGTQVIVSETNRMQVAYTTGINQMQSASQSAFAQMVSQTNTTFSNMSQNVNTQTRVMTTQVTTTMTQMRSTVRSGMNSLQQIFNAGFRVSTQKVTSEMRSMQNTMTQSMNRIVTTTTTGMNRTNQTITQSMTRSNQTVSTNMRSMVSTVQSSVRTKQSTIQTGYNGMLSSIRSTLNSAVATTRSTMNQAVAIMRSTASQARSAGYNMGMGFNNGLASTRGSILGTARSLANAATSTIRRALKIHSPSRVTEELGEFTGQGFEIGIAGKIRDVRRVADDLAHASIPRINTQATFGGLNNMANGGYATVTNNSTLNVNNYGETTDEDFFRRMLKEWEFYQNRKDVGPSGAY